MHPTVAELKLTETQRGTLWVIRPLVSQPIAREFLHYHVPKSLTALPDRGRRRVRCSRCIPSKSRSGHQAHSIQIQAALRRRVSPG
jgi:hypothetical protein